MPTIGSKTRVRVTLLIDCGSDSWDASDKFSRPFEEAQGRARLVINQLPEAAARKVTIERIETIDVTFTMGAEK